MCQQMRKTMICAAVSVAARALFAADAVYIGSGNGFFDDPARWLNSYVPQAGDTAIFLPGGNGQITNRVPFSLSSILVNTNDANWTVAFYGETNTLTAPAVIAVSNNTLSIRTGALTGTDGFTFYGKKGTLELQNTNLITGPLVARSGRILPRFDVSLGPVPAVLDPAAITLDGGMIGNYDSPMLTLAPTRGITLGPDGGYIHGRSTNSGIAIPAPVTGPGSLTIIRQVGDVELGNPANDYAGDTILGALSDVGYYSATDARTLLRLGTDEVLPDGPGKGRLVFTQGHDGILDLNGYQETVNSIVATNEIARLTSRRANPSGTLHVGSDNADLSLNALLSNGVTLDAIGTGTLRFGNFENRSSGTVSVSDGTLALSDAAFLGTGGVSLALNGGGLALAPQPGLAEYRTPLSNSNVNTNATDLTFSGVWLTPRMADQGIIAFPGNTQYLYTGEWHIPAAATYSFGKAFDDGACLIIDGKTILFNNIASAIVVTNNIALSAGWHTIRLYVSQGGGSFGPTTARGFTSAILYDPNNGSITNALGLVQDAYPFADPGDGSVLRVPPPSSATALARLDINASATFDRSAARSAALVWGAPVVSANGATLTVAGGSEPFTVGSTNRPVIFDADISDANGVRFQNKAWLKRLPLSYTLGPGADLAAGVPGLLGTGRPQTLSAYSLRLPTPDALGDPANAPVTVNTGRTLTFDSTTELNSRLIDDPARAFTASNAVTLAGGTLAFDGPGTITLDAPVGGSGALLKSGAGTALLAQPSTFTGAVTVAAGTLSAASDEALGDPSNPVTLTGGTLDLSALAAFSRPLTFATGTTVRLPNAPFAFNGPLTGSLTKTGPAPLTIGGATPNPALDLYVAAGAVTLAKTPGPAVRNVLGVDTNASLTLAAPSQISGTVRLSGGLLDLAGSSLSVDTFRATVPSTVVTNSGAPATLTVGTGNADGTLLGALAPGIAFAKNGTGSFALAAFPGTSAPASVDATGGLLRLGCGAPTYVRLTILKTRALNNNPRVGELVLTRNGLPVPYRTNVTASATSSHASHPAASAVDGITAAFWLATANNNQSLTIILNGETVFDGYRLYNGANTDCDSSNDPDSWRLEISNNNSDWTLVDTVTNAPLYSNAPAVKIFERTLNPAAWPSAPFAAATPVTVAAGAGLRAATPGLALATLSGAGSFDVPHGATVALGDASAFTGTFTGAGELLVPGGITPLDIPASGIPAARPNKIYNTGIVSFPPSFLTVRNTEQATVAVSGTSFAGRLEEAAAPLGLTKTGPGKTLLLDTGSAYTGDTAIESGTLAISPGARQFRYIKFNVTATYGQPNSGYAMAYAEFQLRFKGQVVAWPAGTVANEGYVKGNLAHADDVPGNAIDGILNSRNRWLSQPIQPLIIDTRSGVIFDAYSVWMSGANNADRDRCPKTWTVEGSNNGTTWTVLDTKANVPTPAWVDNVGQLVGTFNVSNSPRAWVPLQFQAETTPADHRITAITASKLVFQVLSARIETTTNDNSGTGYSLTAITLLRNGQPVTWPAGTTAWSPTPGYGTENFGSPTNLFNNSEVADTTNRFYSSSMLNHVIVNAHEPLTFDAYRWVTTFNVPGRDPTHWRLMLMPSDTDAYYVIDEQIGFTPPIERGATVGPFPIVQPVGINAVDAIPDTSRVRIAQNATLELGADAIEVIGPLSGAGTLALAAGSELRINAFEDATFAGAVNGAGATLGLAGDHAQSFTGLSAVPGDLRVAFRGGKFGGTLRIGGALTVTGPVAYATPATLPAKVLLFTFGSIDPGSRDALIAGASSVAVPRGMVAFVKVTAANAELQVYSPGTVLIVR